MKLILVGVVCAAAIPLGAQSATHVPVVSDWTSRHVMYPYTKDASAMQRSQRDPRWLGNWYARHPRRSWPEYRFRWHNDRHRDWSVALSSNPATASFDPTFDFNYSISSGTGSDTGYGSITTTDINRGQFLATGGNITVTGTPNDKFLGTYALYPGGPATTSSPSGAFHFDNVLYPSIDPSLDIDGLLFTGMWMGNEGEINVFGNGPGNYAFDIYSQTQYQEVEASGNPFTLTEDPGAGQTFPAKFVFDVTQEPSCENDYVVIGVPAIPASGGQANIVGLNNLYAGGVGALCPTGPTVMFAYASGTGEVPNAVTISQDGTQLAYIENLTTGSSYFHVLTIGTMGTNGSSATAAVVPGAAGGNNAVDQTLLLSPDGGVTNQSSTNAAWVSYTSGDANDVAFVTTYSTAGSGSGYLYKIANVFNGSAPTIVWSVPISAIPSTPVLDPVSNEVFFTDSNGGIDYVVNSAAPTVVYGPVVASGTTAENPVVVDSTNEMVYATFNSNGTNALVVQAPVSLASSVAVPVGTASTVYGGPYEPAFNNAFYTGSGTPLLYVAGTGSGTLPTLYSIGFNGSVLNSTANSTTAALAFDTADSSPVTEFYNTNLGTDYLFVGVTNDCIATVNGGTAGCVMALDITNGFPTVNANSIALAAAGGTSGIIVDNDSTANQASSIYYATKTGATLVKATQSGLQ